MAPHINLANIDLWGSPRLKILLVSLGVASLTFFSFKVSQKKRQQRLLRDIENEVVRRIVSAILSCKTREFKQNLAPGSKQTDKIYEQIVKNGSSGLKVYAGLPGIGKRSALYRLAKHDKDNRPVLVLQYEPLVRPMAFMESEMTSLSDPETEVDPQCDTDVGVVVPQEINVETLKAECREWKKKPPLRHMDSGVHLHHLSAKVNIINEPGPPTPTFKMAFLSLFNLSSPTTPTDTQLEKALCHIRMALTHLSTLVPHRPLLLIPRLPFQPQNNTHATSNYMVDPYIPPLEQPEWQKEEIQDMHTILEFVKTMAEQNLLDVVVATDTGFHTPGYEHTNIVSPIDTMEPILLHSESDAPPTTMKIPKRLSRTVLRSLILDFMMHNGRLTVDQVVSDTERHHVVNVLGQLGWVKWVSSRAESCVDGMDEMQHQEAQDIQATNVSGHNAEEQTVDTHQWRLVWSHREVQDRCENWFNKACV